MTSSPSDGSKRASQELNPPPSAPIHPPLPVLHLPLSASGRPTADDGDCRFSPVEGAASLSPSSARSPGSELEASPASASAADGRPTSWLSLSPSSPDNASTASSSQLSHFEIRQVERVSSSVGLTTPPSTSPLVTHRFDPSPSLSAYTASDVASPPSRATACGPPTPRNGTAPRRRSRTSAEDDVGQPSTPSSSSSTSRNRRRLLLQQKRRSTMAVALSAELVGGDDSVFPDGLPSAPSVAGFAYYGEQSAAPDANERQRDSTPPTPPAHVRAPPPTPRDSTPATQGQRRRHLSSAFSLGRLSKMLGSTSSSTLSSHASSTRANSSSPGWHSSRSSSISSSLAPAPEENEEDCLDADAREFASHPWNQPRVGPTKAAAVRSRKHLKPSPLIEQPKSIAEPRSKGKPSAAVDPRPSGRPAAEGSIDGSPADDAADDESVYDVLDIARSSSLSVGSLAHSLPSPVYAVDIDLPPAGLGFDPEVFLLAPLSLLGVDDDRGGPPASAVGTDDDMSDGTPDPSPRTPSFAAFGDAQTFDGQPPSSSLGLIVEEMPDDASDGDNGGAVREWSSGRQYANDGFGPAATTGAKTPMQQQPASVDPSTPPAKQKTLDPSVVSSLVNLTPPSARRRSRRPPGISPPPPATRGCTLVDFGPSSSPPAPTPSALASSDSPPATPPSRMAELLAYAQQSSRSPDPTVLSADLLTVNLTPTASRRFSRRASGVAPPSPSASPRNSVQGSPRLAASAGGHLIDDGADESMTAKEVRRWSTNTFGQRRTSDGNVGVGPFGNGSARGEVDLNSEDDDDDDAQETLSFYSQESTLSFADSTPRDTPRLRL